MNRILMAIVAALGGGICAAGGAEGESRNPFAKATQEEANSFYGMSEQELVTAVGYPFEIKQQTASGVLFKYYYYISESNYVTYFTISSVNGAIVTGQLKGTKVVDPNWKPSTPSAGGQAIGGRRSR